MVLGFLGGWRRVPLFPMLSLMYARSENYCIGRAGGIPWHLPDELSYFKRTTLHAAVIMGRRTYEDHQTLLVERLNIVVSRQPHYAVASGVVLVASLEQALALAKQRCERVFVVGGVELFRWAFPMADVVYETIVHTVIEGGDTFVPEFDFSEWSSETLEEHAADRKHAFAYTAWLHRRRTAGER